MADRAPSHASIPPPTDFSADVQWLADLRHRIWETRYRSRSQRALLEGLRERKERLTSNDLERIASIVSRHGLRVEIIAPDGPQVKIYLPETDGEELLRISWWHVPTSMDDARYRRRLAWKIFRHMAGLESDD